MDPTPTDPTKRLHRTSEFALALLAALLIPANQVLDLGLPVDGVLATVGIVVAYGTSRSLAKSTGAKVRDGVQTVEFWTTVGSSVGLLLAEKFGLHLTPDQVVAIVTTISSLILGRGVVKRAAAAPAPADIGPSVSGADVARIVEEKLKGWRPERQ